MISSNKWITIISLITAVAHLNGCTPGMVHATKKVIDDAREKQVNQYLASVEGQTINIPDGLGNGKFDKKFNLPEGRLNSSTAKVTVLPPDSLLERQQISERLPVAPPIAAANVVYVKDKTQPRLLLKTSIDEAFLIINTSLRAFQMQVMDADAQAKRLVAIPNYTFSSGRLAKDKVPHLFVLRAVSKDEVEVLLYLNGDQPAPALYTNKVLSTVYKHIKRK